MGLSARGVAAMTENERALPAPYFFRKAEEQSVGAAASPIGKDRRCWRLRQRAFTGARWRSRSWQGEGSTPESRIG